MNEPSFINRNYVREWIEYAEKNGEDYFFHFFCYYLSINYLFDNYLEDAYQLGERESLTQFLLGTLPRLISEDHFSLPRAIPELQKPVKVDRPRPNQQLTPVQNFRRPFTVRFNGTNYCSEGEDRQIHEDIRSIKNCLADNDLTHAGQWEVILIFHRIYQVRCNLFHGGKSVRKLRDRDLVRESALVMKRFLQSYLKVFQCESTSTIEFTNKSYIASSSNKDEE